MCGCEYCISSKSMHSSLISCGDHYLKTQGSHPKCLKYKVWGKRKFTYMKLIKKTVMPHGRNIYAKAYDMAKATICANPQSNHALPQ